MKNLLAYFSRLELAAELFHGGESKACVSRETRLSIFMVNALADYVAANPNASASAIAELHAAPRPIRVIGGLR